MNLRHFLESSARPLAASLALALSACATWPPAPSQVGTDDTANTAATAEDRVPVLNPKPPGPTLEREEVAITPVAQAVPASKEAPTLLKPMSAQQLVDAVSSPLNDLNLLQNPIPPALVAARLAPYHVDELATCESVRNEVQTLDTLLGPDVDATRLLRDDTLVDVVTEEVGEAALGAIKGMTAGLMPFRSWIRRLSGAHRNAKEVGTAVVAGGARRAFLKGWLKGQNC